MGSAWMIAGGRCASDSAAAANCGPPNEVRESWLGFTLSDFRHAESWQICSANPG